MSANAYTTPGFPEQALRRYRLTPAVTALKLRHTIALPSGRILYAVIYPRDMAVTNRPAIRVPRERFRGADGRRSRFAGVVDPVTILLTWAECLPVTDDEASSER